MEFIGAARLVRIFAITAGFCCLTCCTYGETTPIVSSGLQLWLRADQGITKDSADRVSAWADLSGHGVNFVQANYNWRPLLKGSGLGGQSAVEFDGSRNMVALPVDLQAGATDLTVIAVMKSATMQGGWATILDQAHSYSHGFVFRRSDWSAGYHLAWFDTAGLEKGAAQMVTPLVGVPQMVCFVKRGTEQEAYLNGSQQMMGLNSGTMVTPLAQLALGATTTLERSFTGQIAEILVYNRALSESERQQIEASLINRYNLDDADQDGLPDDWELKHLNSLIYGAGDDPGNVGRTLLQSYSTGVTPWSAPIVSSGLQLWLRADQGITKDSADRVSAWTDLSGHGVNFVQSEENQRPTWKGSVFGGRAAVNFDGTVGLRALPVDLLGEGVDLTVITAVKASASQSGWATILDQDEKWHHGFVLRRSEWSADYHLAWTDTGGVQRGTAETVTLQTDVRQLISIVKNGTLQEGYIDGAKKSSGVEAGTMLTPAAEIGLGFSVGHGRQFKGEIAEILIYNRALSETERQQIEADIISRYSVGEVLLTILGGDNQAAAPSAFNPLPFDVAVWNVDGTLPLADVPVVFSVLNGGGLLAASNSGSALGNTLVLHTDAEGTAQAWYRQPFTANIVSQIQASAGLAHVIFQTSSLDSLDRDADGLLDAWELKQFGTLDYGPNDDPGSVGRTLIQSYEQNLSPWPSATVSEGLRAWFRADLGVTKDAQNKVSRWADVSGNGFHVEQTVEAQRQPESANAALNGQAAVRFSQANQNLTTPGPVDLLVGNNDVTVITVVKPEATQPTYSTIVNWGTDGNIGYGLGSGSLNSYELSWADGTGSESRSPVMNAQAGRVQVLSVTKSGATAASYLNGVGQGTSMGTATMVSTPWQVAVGNRTGPYYGFNGQIAEVLVYNRALTEAERQQIEAQLTTKYSIGIVEPQLVAGGDQALWLDQTGTARAWGRNQLGQLGDGTILGRPQMRRINLPTSVKAVALGETHGVAAAIDGRVYTWGNNYFGQLGDGTSTNRRTPILVDGLTNILQVAAGDHHSLVLRDDGTVWTWGGNQSGQLGDGTTTNRTSPVQVTSLANITHIVAGARHSAALAADGTVWVWGSNEFGQLGADSIEKSATPLVLSGLQNVIALASGRQHLLALAQSGTVWAWGDNHAGQLGLGLTRGQTTPQPILALSTVTALVAGSNHSAALTSNGTVFVWGANDVGQLGNGTTVPNLTPVALTLTGVKALAAGRDHTVAMKNDGSLIAWGSNALSQLGSTTTADDFSNTPVSVSSPID